MAFWVLVLAVGATAAFYGLGGPPNAPTVPLQSATPGAPCTAGGPLGAYADHVYECVSGHWQILQ